MKFALCIQLGTSFVAGCFADDPVEIPGSSQSGDAGDGGAPGDSDSATVPSPEGCNPNHEPTWDNPLDKMMQAQCTRCHEETKTYDAILPWVENGLLEEYCAKGSGHFLTAGKEYCLRWIEIGAPKAPCDVAPGQ